MEEDDDGGDVGKSATAPSHNRSCSDPHHDRTLDHRRLFKSNRMLTSFAVELVQITLGSRTTSAT